MEKVQQNTVVPTTCKRNVLLKLQLHTGNQYVESYTLVTTNAPREAIVNWCKYFAKQYVRDVSVEPLDTLASEYLVDVLLDFSVYESDFSQCVDQLHEHTYYEEYQLLDYILPEIIEHRKISSNLRFICVYYGLGKNAYFFTNAPDSIIKELLTLSDNKESLCGLLEARGYQQELFYVSTVDYSTQKYVFDKKDAYFSAVNALQSVTENISSLYYGIDVSEYGLRITHQENVFENIKISDIFPTVLECLMQNKNYMVQDMEITYNEQLGNETVADHDFYFSFNCVQGDEDDYLMVNLMKHDGSVVWLCTCKMFGGESYLPNSELRDLEFLLQIELSQWRRNLMRNKLSRMSQTGTVCIFTHDLDGKRSVICNCLQIENSFDDTFIEVMKYCQNLSETGNYLQFTIVDSSHYKVLTLQPILTEKEM